MQPEPVLGEAEVGQECKEGIGDALAKRGCVGDGSGAGERQGEVLRVAGAMADVERDESVEEDEVEEEGNY